MVADHKIIMRTFYYNILYACNSNCRFCAADYELEHQSIAQEQMSVVSIKSSLEKNNVGIGDRIIINGGEPTLHPDFFEIMKAVGDTGADVFLFTNGVTLSQSNNIETFLNCKVSKISIPIYGSNAKIHDHITRQVGSLEKTLKAIEKIRKLRKGDLPQIEIKTLLCRSNINDLDTLCSFMLPTIGADLVLLSNLIPSDVAIINNEVLNKKETVDAMNVAVSCLLGSLSKNVTLVFDGIPLCMLSYSNRIKFLLRRSSTLPAYLSGPEEFYYYSPEKSEKISDDIKWKETVSVCTKEACKYKTACRLNVYRNNPEELMKLVM